MIYGDWGYPAGRSSRVLCPTWSRATRVDLAAAPSAQQLPVKRTWPALRLVRSTNTEACSYSRVKDQVPALRAGGPLGRPSAHFACGKNPAGTSESGCPGLEGRESGPITKRPPNVFLDGAAICNQGGVAWYPALICKRRTWTGCEDHGSGRVGCGAEGDARNGLKSNPGRRKIHERIESPEPAVEPPHVVLKDTQSDVKFNRI